MYGGGRTHQQRRSLCVGRDGVDACARSATLVSRLGALSGQPRSERAEIVRRVLSGLWLRCAEARGNGCVPTRLCKRKKTQPAPRRPAGQAARRLTAAASATVRVWSLVRGPAKAPRQGSTASIFLGVGAGCGRAWSAPRRSPGCRPGRTDTVAQSAKPRACARRGMGVARADAPAKGARSPLPQHGCAPSREEGFSFLPPPACGGRFCGGAGKMYLGIELPPHVAGRRYTLARRHTPTPVPDSCVA